MTRKHRLRFIQLSLMIVGILFFYYTYYYKEKNLNKSLIPTQKQEEIQEKIANQADGSEVFTNIEYTGLDISGNLPNILPIVTLLITLLDSLSIIATVIHPLSKCLGFSFSIFKTKHINIYAVSFVGHPSNFSGNCI